MVAVVAVLELCVRFEGASGRGSVGNVQQANLVMEACYAWLWIFACTIMHVCNRLTECSAVPYGWQSRRKLLEMIQEQHSRKLTEKLTEN